MSAKYLRMACWLTILLITFSCGKDSGNNSQPPSNTKKIIEFKFEASKNSGVLQQDIVGVISNTTIRLSVPEGTDLKRLVATFQYDGAVVYVENVKQQSGSTANNFTKRIVYTVEAEDGSDIDYTLVWTEVGDDEKELRSFSFLQSLNPGIGADIEMNISGNAITGAAWSETKTLVATFETDAAEVTVGGVKQISGESANDFSKPVVYVLKSKLGNEMHYSVAVTWESQIPHLYITTAGKTPVTSKDDYLNATLTINGKGIYDDYSGTTRIRGRGNSTWGMPKKPYRLKLDTKAKLLGLKSEKDWVLLANYMDPTLMLNAVAMKIGQELNLPYTNHTMPIDVTLNDKYIGNYMFTEQVEISSSRVDIDETNGVLLEIDANFDEDWKFRSKNYAFPVMVKGPDITSDQQLQKIKNDYEQMEDAVASPDFPNNNYLDYIDADALVGFLIVYNLTHNMEINHPKSVYMSKNAGGKYVMGPIWDFDWAYGYEGTGVHFGSYTLPLFSSQLGNGVGRKFFERFLQDPQIKALYKKRWSEFKLTGLGRLYTYIDEYALLIQDSQAANFKIWTNHNGKEFNNQIGRLKEWLKGRVSYIDSELGS